MPSSVAGSSSSASVVGSNELGKKHGGLDNDTQREGAGELLKLLLKQAVDFPQKRTFTIGLYDIWECPWPRPCLARSHGVQET